MKALMVAVAMALAVTPALAAPEPCVRGSPPEWTSGPPQWAVEVGKRQWAA